MMDREKVIKTLTDALTAKENYPWARAEMSFEFIEMLLALLKEQEAVEPKTGHWIYKKYDDMFMCSCCEKYSIRNDYQYCHWCGAKMDMDDEVE